MKSVLNDFFEVPLETKFNNTKFKIGCICPDIIESPKQDLKTKLKATRFELMKNTSPNSRICFSKVSSSSNQIKDYNLLTQGNFHKDNDDIKDKFKFTESNSKFASTNGTSVKSDTNKSFFSPKSSKFTSMNGTILNSETNNNYFSPKQNKYTSSNAILKTETNNNYFSPNCSSLNTSINMFSPSTTSNKYITSSDRKLFALVNKPNVNESLGLRVKNYTSSHLHKSRVNMSKYAVKLDKIPKSIASKLEKKFPEFVTKNKLKTSNNSSVNYDEYQNRVKIRIMRERVEKLINK